MAFGPEPGPVDGSLKQQSLWEGLGPSGPDRPDGGRPRDRGNGAEGAVNQ